MRNACSLGWYENKKLFIFFGLFALAGIILGSIVIFDPMLNHLRITQGLLDGNVRNVTMPGRTIIAFFAARLFDTFFGLVLVFILSLSKWTVLFVFPYIALRGFFSVINLFWIIDRFGMFHGLPFFLIYLVILFIVLIFFIVAATFILKRASHARQYGFKCGFSWREIRRPIFHIIIGIATIAFLEWLLYFLILGRMVYVF